MMEAYSYTSWVVVRDDGRIEPESDERPEPFFTNEKGARSLAREMTSESKRHPAYERPAKYRPQQVTVTVSATDS